jgi:hypothetical protein
MSKKQKLLFGGVFATHTEWNENGEVVERDEFHMRLYWDLWHSGAMMNLKGAKLHVLLTIAMHADKNAKGFPSVRRLQSLLPYNKNAINTAIKELIELGYLERTQERGENGLFAHNIYKIKYTSPCTEKQDTVKTEENQEVEPCTENTDTEKTVDRKTVDRKSGLKEDLELGKKDPSLKKDIDDDAERIPDKWESDSLYIAFRDVFVKAGASDIKKHDEHYQKFLDSVDKIGFGKLIQAAEECVQKEKKAAQIVLFLSGQYNQYIHRDKPASNKRKARTTGKPVSLQQKIMDRIDKAKQETAAGFEDMTDEELQQFRENSLKLLEQQRNGFSPTS